MPATNAPVAEGGAQHLIALQRANEVRLKRAAVKRWVAEPKETRASRARAAQVILAVQRPSAAPRELELVATDVGGMAVMELLLACERVGRTLALKLLSRVPLVESKPLVAMTPRQATYLAQLLSGEVHEQLALAQS